MFYIQQDEKVVLVDENLERLQNTVAFMPQYQGLEIKEVQEGYVIYDFELMTVEEMEEKQKQKERERLDNLSMTRGDVFEALILAKGLGKAQIRAMIEQAELDTVTKALYLNRFDEALEFYRGYPIFDMLGQALRITSEMLDKFFETKDYQYLTKKTLTINATPSNSVVTINGVETNIVEVPYGTDIEYSVELEGYTSYYGSIKLIEDKVINVELIEVTNEEIITNDSEVAENDV